jgi:hypothetical protein
VKTRTKLILAGILVVIVLLAVMLAVHQSLQRRALHREIAVWEAAGLPLDPLALYPPNTPEGERLARAFLDLMAGVDEKMPYFERDSAEDYIQKYGTDEELSAMRAGESPWGVVADHFAADIQGLRRLLEADTPWSWPASMLADDLRPGIPRVYHAARLLRIEAMAQAEQGNATEAVANLVAALRLSENAVLFPGMAGLYAHYSLDRDVLETLAEIARAQPVPTEEIERHLQQRDYRPAFVRGLKAGAAQVWTVRDDWQELLGGIEYDYNPTFGRFTLDRRAAVFFADMREALDRVAAPFAEQEDPSWGPECPRGWPFHNGFFWGFPYQNARVADAEVRRQMALFAFEVQRQVAASDDVATTLLEIDPPFGPAQGRPISIHADETGLRFRLESALGREIIAWEWTFHE